jgi:hypothetical protein
MGHERVGYLPKSKKWRSLVAEIADVAEKAGGISQIAADTLAAVGHRYLDLASDPSIRAAFEFLVDITRQSGSPQKEGLGLAHKGALELTLELEKKLPRSSSLEIRALAFQSATDAVVQWRTENTIPWGELFVTNSPVPPLRGLGTAAGFSELTRLFFASLTARYLKYFLEREATSVIPRIEERNAFNRNLDGYLDQISRHAFESAKITQSFAAGWFNKYAAAGVRPAKPQLRRFLDYAFSKLREELRRSSAE